MNRGLRIYILDHKKVVIPINKVGFYLTGNNFTKNIVNHFLSRFFITSTILLSRTVSCIPVSISLIIIVPSSASFWPNISVYLTPKRLAILNWDLILSRPKDDFTSMPLTLKFSNKIKLFLLAASPNWTKNTFGLTPISGTDLFFSLRAKIILSMPIAQPAAGVFAPP